MSRNGRIATALAIVVIAAVTLLALRRSKTTERFDIPLPPTTSPVGDGAPSTRSLTPVSYVDLIRERYPEFPATQPLGVPVDYADASRIVLDVPVYLSATNDLWITHPQAPSTEQILSQTGDQPIHVTRECVAFVFWTARPDMAGKWDAELIVRADDGSFEHVTKFRRRPLPWRRHYDFSRAVQWQNRIVVPGDEGVSIFDFAGDSIVEEFCAVTSESQNPTPTQITVDQRGILAWRPWENETSGGPTIHRFVDGMWTALPDDASRVVQLIPLLDGSLLQIAIDPDGKVIFRMTSLDDAKVDQAQVAELVARLSDPDDEMRSAAFDELTRYGSGLSPVLENLIDDQPPEAQVRLRQLLAGRLEPTMGGMKLLDGRLRLVNRLRDGGAVFYAQAGVSVPAPDGGESFVAPAWLSCRPGRAISLLPFALVRDLTPQHHIIDAFANEWILNDPVLGPRRFMGNHFVNLLSSAECERFNCVIGIDRRGRWLFAHSSDPSQTLIVDPTLPDPTPRLPVWTMSIRNGTTGWTSDDWPAIRRGGAWALRADSWEALDESKTPMITEMTEPKRPPATTQHADKPLCVDEHGCAFYDGRTTLRRVTTDGSQCVWPLPGELLGSDSYEPTLIPAAGALLLFNQSGRVARLIESDESFDVGAIFTHDVPNTDSPTRIWLDPAGRINVVHDGNQLHVMFPDGQIPSSIRTLMPADADDASP